MHGLARSALSLIVSAASVGGSWAAPAMVAERETSASRSASRQEPTATPLRTERRRYRSTRPGTGDPEVLGACAKVPDATLERALCLGEFAAQNRDAMLCRDTHLRGRKGYAGPLYETCFAAFARGTGDPELCAPLEALIHSSANSICLAYMAGEEGDASVCAGDGLCAAHLAGMIKDASLCEPLDFEHRQHCLYRVAVSSIDVERCAEIFGDWGSACYRDTAALLGQPEICKLGPDYAPVRSACYTAVASALLEPSVCDNVEEDRPRELCVMRIAEESGDSDLCATLENPIERPKCYLRVAKVTTDPELCGAIETTTDFGKETHDECVVYMATESGIELRDEQLLVERARVKHRIAKILESGDANRCGELRNYTPESGGGTIWAKDRCYTLFARGGTRVEDCDWQLEPVECQEQAKRATRPKLCKEVDHERDQCYWHAARNARDAAVCDGILEEDPLFPRNRQQCYAMIAVISGDENGCRRVEDEELRSECLAEAAVAARPGDR